MNRLYRHVGTESGKDAAPSPKVFDVESRQELMKLDGGSEGSWCFVVDGSGKLCLAPRPADHLLLASHGPVFAAGELTTGSDGSVLEASNLATGYCPEPECWLALQSVLDRAGIPHPGAFTREHEFRFCPDCQCRALADESGARCPACQRPLLAQWNFERVRCYRAFQGPWTIDRIEEAASSTRDRARVFGDASALGLAVADGAESVAGGAEAAQVAVDLLPTEWSEAGVEEALTHVDRRLAGGGGGQTSAVVLRLSDDGEVSGGSVGDSEAWVRDGGRWREVTRQQRGKPLLGHGKARPVAFAAAGVDAALVATDGFARWVPMVRWRPIVDEREPWFPWRLADEARSQMGELQDDLTILVASRRSPRTAS